MPKNKRAVSEALESRRLLANATVDLATLASTTREWGDEGLLITYSPPAHYLRADAGMLTAKQKGDPFDIAMNYLRTNVAALGVAAADVDYSRVDSQYTDSDTGVTHIYLQQTLRGLPVLGADLGIHLTRGNEVINVGGGFVGGLGKQNGAVPAPQVSSLSAITGAARTLGLNVRTLPSQFAENTFVDASLSDASIETELVYVARDEGPRLAWKFQLQLPAPSSDWYELAVDANSGETIWAHNYTSHASYNVYAQPGESPSSGARTLVTDPHDLVASPFGWHDNNGVAGAEFTDTRGNNVRAEDDIDGVNSSVGSRPDGGASLNFDLPINLANSPTTYTPASVGNLFYWNNLLHDIHYRYGFTESAGNFQTNTYGNGGSGNDWVLADAQDGSGFNNANFSSPPDGSAGRMQMYLFNHTSPNRDGDLDNGIIIHEYGHGVSTRLTGGPANAYSLDTAQSGGMGEGWSDFWALAFTAKASDSTLLSRPIGTYALGQSTTGRGIRRFPYTFNMSVNPLTVDAYGTGGTTSYGTNRSVEVHNTGEIWAATLWDLHTLLGQKYGFSSDIASGYTTSTGAGNKLALKLVMDALKLQPANPSFAQARDAILQADVVLTGGVNRNEIWAAFARRGMGASFNSGSSSGSSSVAAAFDVPPADPMVQLSWPTGSTIIAPTSFTFKFSEPINPASFAIADDVPAFTGPGGASYLDAITGYSFNPGATKLTITFNAPAVKGVYTMTIGPDILSGDDGHAMDQNKNGTYGEASDVYSNSLTYSSTLSDPFGYTAGEWQFENLDLAPGGAGVTRLIDNTDDSSFSLPIGTNSFRFYDTTYDASTSPAIGVSENGFVSFGSLSRISANTDLASPEAARVAALWDDWVTNQSGTDQVLYKYEDTNGDSVSDRLIVEWNDVQGWQTSGNGVTFQVILQLNTGTRPGTILVNYVDTDALDPQYSNGVGATLGLKDTGAPPPYRLLVSQDNGSFPWVGPGKAIRYSTDWTPPTASVNNSLSPGPPQTLQYQFSEDVGASLSTQDLLLFNHTINSVVSSAGVTLNYSTGQVATFNLNGTLPDGDYTATLAAAGITDASWMPLTSDVKIDFFVLNADATRDRLVDTQDFNILAANFGETRKIFSEGDFNNDSTVASDDFNILVSQFGTRLTMPMSPPNSLSPATSPFAGSSDSDRIALTELE